MFKKKEKKEIKEMAEPKAKPAAAAAADKINNIVRELKKKKEVNAIYLFGSYMRGIIKPYSDIDICVITKRNISKKAKEDILSNSSREIDISLFWEIPTAIKYRIIKDGRLLFERNSIDLQRVKINTIKAYLDFQPMIKRHCLNALGY